MHQPFAAVLPARDAILIEAACCLELAGQQPSTERNGLIAQMDGLTHVVNGHRFQTALRKLRETT